MSPIGLFKKPPAGPPASEIDHLFPALPHYPEYHYGVVDRHNIPFAARAAVELLHDERPDAVIGADRGARPFALATHTAWHQQYPGERFPTRDGKIHLARLTAKELTYLEYSKLVGKTLIRAGILDKKKKVIPSEERGTDVRIGFMDDWVFQGKSLKLFTSSLEKFGIDPDRMSIYTMCNQPVSGYRHAVFPSFQGWEHSEWKDDISKIGLYFGEKDFGEDPMTPVPAFTMSAFQSRSDIINSVRSHYAEYREALRDGQINSCVCAATEKAIAELATAGITVVQ